MSTQMTKKKKKAKLAYKTTPAEMYEGGAPMKHIKAVPSCEHKR